jgi:D-alanyl-D-alanine carboxypeptidase
LAADAAGDLRKNQANLARQARIITTATAKSGITQIVYALAGYNPTADEVLKAFKLYVQEEAKKYEKERGHAQRDRRCLREGRQSQAGERSRRS